MSSSERKTSRRLSVQRQALMIRKWTIRTPASTRFSPNAGMPYGEARMIVLAWESYWFSARRTGVGDHLREPWYCAAGFPRPANFSFMSIDAAQSANTSGTCLCARH